MTILSSDIKLFESERLTDEEDGGGRMTGNVVVDGEVNNLFPDISRLDRVYGRVNLRKAFTGVSTANTDTYYGAHCIIEDAPDDPNVDVCLFSTDSHVDERMDARDFIESYVIQGPESRLRPLGDQLAGQRSITCWQRKEARLPEIGQVYVLSVEDSGHEANGQQQYVRVQDVTSEVQTFSYSTSSGFADFEAQVVTLSLTTELRDNFPGKSPTRDFSSASTVVRKTQVANAARYYGIKQVTAALADGDNQIQLEDVYHPLVPATQAETPQTDIRAGSQSIHEMQSGGETVEVADLANTAENEVTLSNRALTYVKNLNPLPAPGTTVVEYRALGNWNRMEDRGDGKLEGDGTGTVDYATGSVQVTLGAMPDVGTSVIYSWGTPVHYNDRSGNEGDVEVPVVEILPDDDMNPGKLTITWEAADGTEKTASDDGQYNITGDASGRVIYSGPSRRIELVPDVLPDPSTIYALQYETGAPNAESFTVTGGTTDPSFTLGTVPVSPNTVTIRCPVTRRVDSTGDADSSDGTDVRELTRFITDDGNGNLVLDGSNIGTIDYTNGDVAFDPTVDYTHSTWNPNDGWTATTRHEKIPSNALVLVDYADDATNWGPASAEATAPPVRFNLTMTTQETIIPGTVKFDFAGSSFIDRNGRLYRDVDAQGAGTLAGSIDYATGDVQLDDYESGDPKLTVRTLVTRPGDWTVTELFFRTPGSPLQPMSFYLQATDTGGNLIDATVDANGKLSHEYMDGTVDSETGVIRVSFGKMVDDSSLTTEEKNEWWYDPDDVDESGQIWKPRPILPSTASFNCVILSALPLDADLLGLDPVRLPGDGKVPIFQEAGVVVVHNAQSEGMPSPLSAGQEVQLSRSDLALVYLEDADGVTVDEAQYSVDLAAGTVTMADPLDLSGYTEPLVVFHRIEDMLLVTDVEIDGRITVNGGVSRDYPADGTYCSSALIFGDMQARVTNFFSQDNWDGSSWNDERQGSDTTASYNLAQYPVQVENQGAIKERWALEFTSSSAFNIIGETVGVIGTGDTSSDVAPQNPETGTPYFQMDSDGFGSGWQVGNVIRFNTEAAARPIWLARTILAGDATAENDSFRIQNRGDAD